MATQILDTELAVARKNLHFSQRELFNARFARAYIKYFYNLPANTPDFEYTVSSILKRVKYWRMRYNSAMAIKQEREEISCFRCGASDHDWCQNVRTDEF